MDKFIRIKYPVDSIRISATENKLIYEDITILDSKKNLYDNYRKKIESIFDDPSLASINLKIKKLILSSQTANDDVNFISDNQWLLKFVKENDIEILKQNSKFNVAMIKIEFPKQAYMDKKTKKVFYEDIFVPVWKKRMVQYQADLISWLVIDDLNSIEDRFKALILGNKTIAQNLIINNQWLLMLVNEDYRLELMNNFDIGYKSIERSYGYTTSKKLAKRKIIIPETLEEKYIFMESELLDIMSVDDEKVYNYLKEYANSHLDDNSLLRENLWLLNLIKIKEQVEILEILDIKLNLPSKKVVTLRPIDDGRLESYEVDIKLYQYAEYLRLSEAIINLLANDTIDEDSAINLINSNELVLEVWPWLNDFVNQDKLKNRKH